MTRALSLYLPMWSVDLVRRRWRGSRPYRPTRNTSTPDGPNSALVLVDTIAGRQLVQRYCERARRAGVQAGTSLAHARALLPVGSLHVEPYEPTREATALLALAQWATRFTPVVCPDPHQNDGLLMDITGCQRLYGGEHHLLQQLVQAVQRLGFTQPKATIAPTFGASWAIARFGNLQHDQMQTITTYNLRDFLAPLPVRALRIDEPTVEALAEVGIVQVAHLLALPRDALPARFDKQLLRRLDQALGQTVEMIESVRPTPPPCAWRDFDGPVKQLETIQSTARTLLVTLTKKLQQRDSSALQLVLELTRCDAPPLQLKLQLTCPSRDPKHLWALLRPQVESVHMGFGIERITITASRIGPLPPHRQSGHWLDDQYDSARNDCEFSHLLELMSARLGIGRISRFEPVVTHLPERAYRQRPVSESPIKHTLKESVKNADRPSVLFDRPEPAQVIALVPDGPFSHLHWRGEQVHIINRFGPERIAQQWWDIEFHKTTRSVPTNEQATGDATRDYFRVEDERGQWLWLYQEVESGQWFVHGLWA